MSLSSAPLKRLFLTGASIVAIAGFTGIASAQLYGYEGFDYPPGSDILGQSGGTGFSSPWALQSGSPSGQAFSAAAGSLTAPVGLPTSGGHALLTGEFGTLQVMRSFPNISGADGSTTWFSFIGQRQGEATADPNNPYPRGVNVGLFDTESTSPGTSGPRQERIAVGNSSGAALNEWSIIPEGRGNLLAGSGTAYSDLYWAVLRIDHHGDATVADDAYLFLNPDPASEPTLGSALASSIGVTDYSNVDFLRPFVGNFDSSNNRPFGVLALDELRIGGDYASMSAVPEPSTYALMALAGGFGLLYRRMRRK